MKKNFIKIGVFALSLITVASLSSCTGSNQSEETAESEMTADESEDEGEETIASPRMAAEGSIGSVTVKVDYGSPAVKERKIWGGLEDYGKVWRAGANETTNVEFSSDVVINEVTVPAGKYGVFMIPQEEGEWTFILNSVISWGAGDYDEENDIVRVGVTPTWADDVQERLNYEVSDNSINFAWEKARLSIPVAAAE